jgi:hypothetical protein
MRQCFTNLSSDGVILFHGHKVCAILVFKPAEFAQIIFKFDKTAIAVGAP